MTAKNINRKREGGLLAVVALAPSIGALSALWFWPGTIGAAIYALCKFVLYGTPAVVAWRGRNELQLRSGFRSGFSARAIGFGLASGAAIGGCILAGWWLLLSDHVDLGPMKTVLGESGMTDPVRYWVFALWLIIGNSLLEECVFRWFVDSRLQRLGIGPFLALPISAAIFSVHHVIVLAAYFEWPMIALGSAGVFAGGLIWSWSLRRYDSLIPGWISHALVDLAIVIIGASILTAS